MTDEALARKLAAAFCGADEGSPSALNEFDDYRRHWLRVAAMARTLAAMEKA
jgi:hypothetical protein